MADGQAFDAVLIVAFGGPMGPADVRPFLANVLRGRRIPPHRIEEVVANYLQFGGVSPLTEITQRQAARLQARLRQAGGDLPVYVGMRNWHPFLADTLREMSTNGVRRAIAFIGAGHHSYSSCQQYKENVRDARQQIVQEGHADIAISYVDSWYDHPLFIETLIRHTRAAIDQLPQGLRAAARVVFTAHSLPISMASRCKYVEQLQTSARLVMEGLSQQRQDLTSSEWALAYQSRSGMPSDPWLEPDIREYLRAEHARGLAAAVIVPLGFVCDHIEVLFDLDTRVAELCREIELPMARAATVGDDPLFVDMMADVVKQTYERYRRFPVLPIVQG